MVTVFKMYVNVHFNETFWRVCILSSDNKDITGTTEYSDKMENNGKSDYCQHVKVCW